MKNTLKICLMAIGIGLIGYGAYTLVFSEIPWDTANNGLKVAGDSTQSLAMMAFGALCLISGIAYTRKKR